MTSTPPPANETHPTDPLVLAARRAAERAERGAREPEPSLGARLGQIGVLGWAIVLPALLGAFLGHHLDRRFGTGVFFAAPLIMIGAALGFRSAWGWMHRNGGDRP